MTDLCVVIMTRNRCAELLTTLERLRRESTDVPIIVVDNGSDDATSGEVARRFPEVELIRLRSNAGVAARNVAVQRTTSPYIAFCDDDSWWEGPSLRRAVELFERHPGMGAVAAHIVVDPDGRDDPTSIEMARSPLPDGTDLPGTRVLGFLACATAVRRSAFVDVGGFEERFHFGREEELLATDLASAGWGVRYVPDLRVHHQPSTTGRDRRWFARRMVRNGLWFHWLRRPGSAAVRGSWRVLRQADARAATAGLGQALLGAPWVLRHRQVVPPRVEADLRLLEDRRQAPDQEYAT